MTRSMLRLIALTGVLAIGLGGAAVAGIYQTEVVSFKTKKLGPGSAEYKVRIEATDTDCFEGRTVQIKHKGVVIGSGSTDSTGRVTIIGARPPRGDRVTAVVLEEGDCKGARKTRKFSP